MRRSFPIWLSALALLAPAAAEARTVRVFAMGPKLDLAWMESRQAYRDKMFALADKTLRGSALIQDGADDFASHRLGRDRDLVVWPEDIGLFAALTGERAAAARASGSLEGAIASLLATYGPQHQYYAERHPALTERVPQTRLLALSLTDTYGRVVIETFSEMADRYDAWLHAGVNMAQDWQIVCVSKAARPDCAEENAEKVERLRDPFEPGRDYAYEATTDKPSNMALLFDPDGKLVSKQVKTYLTPVELLGQLDLVPGSVTGGLSAVETPVGTLGFVTSKDAWMPDVVQKLDQAGVDVLVQPEFFVNDIVCSDCGPMWGPDTLLASGYSAMVRHPSITTLVLPELTGNIFSFTADAQQHIAVEQPRRRASGFLIGQEPSLGLASVMPWAVGDPLAGETMAQRRERLRKAGDALKPGSGVACPDPRKPGPCENGHVEGVLWRDIEIGRAPRFRRWRGARSRTRFSRARPLTRGRRPQRNASVARYGRTVVVAYEEGDRVRVVRSRDGGRSWSRPVAAPAAPPPAGGPEVFTPAPAASVADQWWPAVAAGPRGRVTLAWVEGGAVWFARSSNGARTFGEAVRLAGSDAPQWKPALAQGRGDTVHAVFVDERERSAEDGLPQAGVWYARIAGGQPEKPRRLDSEGAGKQADTVNGEKLNNAWAPAVSARSGRVLVTWLDFKDYDWDVYARLSLDHGEGFADEVVVNDTPPEAEALNDTPRAALGASRAFVTWTDWRKRDSLTAPHQQYDIAIAEPGGDNVRVDPHGTRQASAFAPDICANGRGDAIVAWQDAAKGFNEIRIALMRDGTRRGPARLVNDAPRAGNAWRPVLGCWHGDVVAVWEDDRDGPGRLYTAFAKARRLR